MRNSTITMMVVSSIWIILTATVQASDLAAASIKARASNLPIMILFIDDDCDDCTSVLEEFVKPMLISGEYDDKLIIEIVNTDDNKLRNFENNWLDMSLFTAQYHLELVPTAIFVDSMGRELSEPVSGLSNLDYYGSLLDEAAEISLNKLAGN